MPKGIARALLCPVLLAGVLLAGAAGPALAQMETREGIALQNQILELQREIQVLSQRGAGGGAPQYAPPYAAPYPQAGGSAATSDIVTQLLTRVESLDAAVRDLRGRVDDLTNQLQQQSAQLGKRIDDLQFQLQNPAKTAPGTLPAAPPPSRPPPAAPSSYAPPPKAPPPYAPPSYTPPPALPPNGRRTPELSLQEGDTALARRDYATAEQDARAVLANRASPRAYDAQYLLAQALMGQNQYSQAAIAYDDAYNRQKKGGHAAESLLGLADSLVAINEKRAACDTLTKLRTEFPAARPDIRDRAAQAAKRAACR